MIRITKHENQNKTEGVYLFELISWLKTLRSIFITASSAKHLALCRLFGLSKGPFFCVTLENFLHSV